MTLNGGGDTIITGSIDGGGVLNALGPRGRITKNGAGILSLTGAATYGVPINMTAGTIDFTETASETATGSSAISGTGPVMKSGPGLLILTGTNAYGDGKGYDDAATTINDGALQADRGAGLSPNSALILNGGVLQSNSAVTFTDPFYWGTGRTGRSFTWKSGGFSAGGGKMTVNITGGYTTLKFGNADGRSGIVGIMKLSSTTAQYETEIKNPIDLNGAERTIQVDDNPNSTGDFATLSGAVGDSVGGASLTKTGNGLLNLTAVNSSFSGNINVNGGTLVGKNTNALGAVRQRPDHHGQFRSDLEFRRRRHVRRPHEYRRSHALDPGRNGDQFRVERT